MEVSCRRKSERVSEAAQNLTLPASRRAIIASHPRSAPQRHNATTTADKTLRLACDQRIIITSITVETLFPRAATRSQCNVAQPPSPHDPAVRGLPPESADSGRDRSVLEGAVTRWLFSLSSPPPFAASGSYTPKSSFPKIRKTRAVCVSTGMPFLPARYVCTLPMIPRKRRPSVCIHPYICLLCLRSVGSGD